MSPARECGWVLRLYLDIKNARDYWVSSPWKMLPMNQYVNCYWLILRILTVWMCVETVIILHGGNVPLEQAVLCLAPSPMILAP